MSCVPVMETEKKDNYREIAKRSILWQAAETPSGMIVFINKPELYPEDYNNRVSWKCSFGIITGWQSGSRSISLISVMERFVYFLLPTVIYLAFKGDMSTRYSLSVRLPKLNF